MEYIGQLVDEKAEAKAVANKIGWRLKWPRGEEEGILDRLLRIVEECERTRYVALAYSENTDTYYVFAHPSKRIYHFTKADIAYFALTQLEEYVRTIVEEERALMEGRWGERGFILIKEETVVYDGLRALGGIEWKGRIHMRYLWRNAAYNGIYVLADFAGRERYRAWRRLELSSLCLDCLGGSEEECREECENALVRQFFEP